MRHDPDGRGDKLGAVAGAVGATVLNGGTLKNVDVAACRPEGITSGFLSPVQMSPVSGKVAETTAVLQMPPLTLNVPPPKQIEQGFFSWEGNLEGGRWLDIRGVKGHFDYAPGGATNWQNYSAFIDNSVLSLWNGGVDLLDGFINNEATFNRAVNYTTSTGQYIKETPASQQWTDFKASAKATFTSVNFYENIAGILLAKYIPAASSAVANEVAANSSSSANASTQFSAFESSTLSEESAATTTGGGPSSGFATIYHYKSQSRFGHYSIEVTSEYGNTHTHQVYRDAAGTKTTISDVIEDSPLKRAVVELPDAQSAFLYQMDMLDVELGPYDLIKNSCQTHIGNVLREGGVVIPTEAKDVFEFLKNLNWMKIIK
jgi:hypothetical protein